MEEDTRTSMSDSAHAEILARIISALGPLDPEARERILETVLTFYRMRSITPAAAPASRSESSTGRAIGFSDDLSVSPKEFLLAKQPRTDVERVACLAYYLTHYREAAFFKTADISQLNTEAAQPRLTNAAYSASNAVKSGYLAVATGDKRQLSAAGEQFVRALPDREAARAAMAHARPKRRGRKLSKSDGDGDAEVE